MKIGLFFGSFNPIHIGHLILANHFHEFTELNEIWFVVTPQSPFKKNKTLAQDYERLHMVQLAIKEYPFLRASDVEFKLPTPNYTVNTLAVLKEKYPQHSFSLLMGEDNLTSLHKWRNSEWIVKEHSIYVYPRLEAVKKKPQVPLHNIIKVDAPKIEVSSTWIRRCIRENKSVKPFLTCEVLNYIDRSSMYR